MSRLFPEQASLKLDGYLGVDPDRLVPASMTLDQDSDTISCRLKLTPELMAALGLPPAPADPENS